MLDIFHLSYYEPFADETFAKLQSRFPWAKRIQNIKGIFNGHKECARQSLTTMFYVVDADAILKDNFDFSYTPSPKLEYWDGVKQTECVHVWRCENPVNGLVYGYGGVKLFPREPLRAATDWHIDFTTSVSGKFKVMLETSNSTYINANAFTAYKSGFRECAKLASKTIKDPEGYYDSANDPIVLAHLEIWCTKGAGPFGSWAVIGAKDGRKYGEESQGDTEALDKINDFKWLEEKFNMRNEAANTIEDLRKSMLEENIHAIFRLLPRIDSENRTLSLIRKFVINKGEDVDAHIRLKNTFDVIGLFVDSVLLDTLWRVINSFPNANIKDAYSRGQILSKKWLIKELENLQVIELYDKPDTVINTSCEHIENFREWYDGIDKGTLVILQTNDYHEIEDHINCVDNIDQFKEMAPMTDCMYDGVLNLDTYNRFMLIGYR